MPGCALVLGGIPSLRELWDGAAVFVPPDNHEALERKIKALCAVRAYRKGMAEKTWTRSRSFTPEKMAAGYIPNLIESRTILARHTCGHRVNELLAICRESGLHTNDTPAAGVREKG